MLFLNILVVVIVHLCAGGHLARSYSLGETPKLGVIRGSDAPVHAVPSIAFVVENVGGRIFNCGGTLVHKQFVLTAAHCLAEPGVRVQRVYLGLHKFNRADANQTFDLTTRDFKFHGGYKTDNSSAHDIGLIKLPRAATIHPGIVERAHIPEAAILDPSNMDIYAGEEPTMYGWGLIEERPRDKFPEVLQMLTGKAVPYDECEQVNRSRNNTLCVRRLDPTRALACRGDSGGPLILNGKQIGVVSGGSVYPVACYRSVFAIFTRLDYHRRWISNVIWNWDK